MFKLLYYKGAGSFQAINKVITWISTGTSVQWRSYQRLSPVGKERTEMTVSAAWATVKRDGHERGETSRSEIPPVCLGLCPQLCSDGPQRCRTPATITHVSNFDWYPFLIFLIKQCIVLTRCFDSRSKVTSSFEHLRAPHCWFEFFIWYNRLYMPRCTSQYVSCKDTSYLLVRFDQNNRWDPGYFPTMKSAVAKTNGSAIL